jgi:hypothetical protein
MEVCPEAGGVRELAQRFWELVRERRAERLDEWLAAAFQSKLAELEAIS